MRELAENRNIVELSGDVLNLFEASDHEFIVKSIYLVISLSLILFDNSDIINSQSTNQ